MLKQMPVTPVLLSENVGYAKANNKAFARATGEFILFLNSDVYVQNVNLYSLGTAFRTNPDWGALTVRVNLEDGSLDKASHRGFPTPWHSFCYYAGLHDLAKHVSFLRPLFGGYHLLHKDLTVKHEVDVISGAFFMTRKKILQEVGAFDEDFFMYGEDIDLAYRIKQSGRSIIYDPQYHVLHLKYKSGIGTKDTLVQKEIRRHFFDAMKIFYKKHYESKYPFFINALVYAVISFKMRRV
jgi:hypothetical protein